MDEPIEYNIDKLVEQIEIQNELLHNYSIVICSTTGGNLSYTDYEPSVVIREITKYQEETCYDYIKSDLLDIINDSGSIEDIKEYLNNL